jgi:hypothetical protein
MIASTNPEISEVIYRRFPQAPAVCALVRADPRPGFGDPRLTTHGPATDEARGRARHDRSAALGVERRATEPAMTDDGRDKLVARVKLQLTAIEAQ